MATIRRRRTLAPGNREEGDGFGEGEVPYVRALLEPCFVGGGMTRSALFRSLAGALGAVSLVAACGGGGGTTSETLAADQTLRFAIIDYPTSLDPAHVDSAVDITFLSEVFTGLLLADSAGDANRKRGPRPESHRGRR